MLPSWPTRLPSGRAVVDVYRADEREALGLLLLPFLLLAFGIGVSQSLRPGHRAGDWVTSPFATTEAARPRLRLPPAEQGRPVEPGRSYVAAGAAPPAAIGPAASELEAARPVPALDSALPPAEAARQTMRVSDDSPEPASPPVSTLLPAGVTVPHSERPILANVTTEAAAEHTAARQELAALPSPSDSLMPTPSTSVVVPRLPDEWFQALPETSPPGSNICTAPERPKLASLGPADSALARDPVAFGQKLAEAARAQLDDLVVYNDAYRRISYPNGDVSALFGVCTDVVIRAYRALGVDLQALVHTSRTGSGDTNIDHRRVETLRRFFATRGASLPITDYPEDYRPGDIVTYYRPQNRHSRSHIAIVSDAMGPSGRPMILHNRGWGVQLEDGLFVDRITGHYRFSAAPAGPVPAPGTRITVVDAGRAGISKLAQCAPTRPGARQAAHCQASGRGRHASTGTLPRAQ